MQVFILQYFTRIVKNLKKRENTENLCLIIRGSQVQALVGPHKVLRFLRRTFLFLFLLIESCNVFEIEKS